MTSTSAYNSLQRILSPDRGPASPTGARKPIPTFSFEPVQPVVEQRSAPRAVVSSCLGWWKLKELVELEYEYMGRAPPVLNGERTVLAKHVEASSSNSGPVLLDILSDALLVSRDDGAVELFLAAQVSFKDNSFTLTPSPSSSPLAPEQLTLLPSPSLSSFIPLLSSTFPPFPPPSSPLSPSWTPDASLSICESCASTRFNTLTQRKHHCRACGRGICGRCSRWRGGGGEVDQGAGGAGRGESVRVCKECFS